MKIKSIETKRRLGRKRGTPIELSPSEKAVEAVKDALHAQNTEDLMFLVQTVNVDEINMLPKREATSKKRKPEYQKYNATGAVSFKHYYPKKDSLRRSKTEKFKIRFQDHPDENGLPDLKVLDFEVR